MLCFVRRRSGAPARGGRCAKGPGWFRSASTQVLLAHAWSGPGCVGGYAPRALEDSVRSRHKSGRGGRPLKLTVRGRNQIRLCNESDKGEEPRQRPFV